MIAVVILGFAAIFAAPLIIGLHAVRQANRRRYVTLQPKVKGEK